MSVRIKGRQATPRISQPRPLGGEGVVAGHEERTQGLRHEGSYHHASVGIIKALGVHFVTHLASSAR